MNSKHKKSGRYAVDAENGPASGAVLLDPVIEGYLAYLRDVGRKAKGTLIDVRCTLRKMVRQMEADHPGVPLWRLSQADYMVWVTRQREEGRSGASLCKYVSHVRGLLEYAWRSGRSDRNVLDGFDLQDDRLRVPPEVLTETQAAKLVASCAAATPLQRRDRMMVLLLYGCGLRTDELCRLNVQDVDQERQELLIWKAKGDRQRVVPIPQGVFTELLAYLGQRGRGGKRGALIRTAAKSCRVAAKDVCEAVRKAAEKANLGTLVTPKTLRHSYATHLMDRGVDLAVISSLMGHRSPAETGVYLHVLGDKPRSAVDRLNDHVGDRLNRRAVEAMEEAAKRNANSEADKEAEGSAKKAEGGERP